MRKTLDLITIGRPGVDLYGGQLKDIGSARARLSFKTALLSWLGNEHMGRLILERLKRKVFSTGGVKTDAAHHTALVVFGIGDDTHVPRNLHCENCADMVLCENDIDETSLHPPAVCCARYPLSHRQWTAPA